MKPAAFGYVRATTLDGAVEALVQHGDEAKLIAGGQSLVPMMNFRLARPSVLVDLDRVAGLDGLAVTGRWLQIGAMARQAAVLHSEEIRQRMPLLIEALRNVGHHQIRTRGTVGGSIAHADPAAELPAVALLTGAELTAQGSSGSRAIAAERFFQGPYTTSLADDEVLTEVRFPLDGIDAWAFEEISRRAGDFAIAGVAAAEISGDVRLVAFGLGWVPIRLGAAETVLAGRWPDPGLIVEASAAARAEVEPAGDLHADADYRRDAVGTLVGRALERLSSRGHATR